MSIVNNLSDAILHSVDPSIRLGITGLSRSGKTVFITSLVANLLERERMLSFSAEADGRIIATQLAEQPDATIARFEFEKHLEQLLAPEPSWPDSTRTISELRLSFKVKRKGLNSLFGEVKTIHLDIIDYPGEWLLDLGLMDKSFSDWCDIMFKRLGNPVAGGEEALKAKLEKFGQNDKLTEPDLSAISTQFHEMMRARKAAGISDLVPGRFLLPAELAGAPAITFAPVKEGSSAYALFEKRFEQYKRKVIKPFFRDHFSKIDRQIVLADVMGALQKGPEAIETLEKSMADILSAFRPGKNNLLSLILGTKIDKIAFVATKADLLHHVHHDKIVNLTRALMKSAERRAQYSGAQTEAKAVASVRATAEDVAKHKGSELKIVRGTRADDGEAIGFHFGKLPEDAEAFIIAKAKGQFNAPKLSPPNLSKRKRAGLPHIRMDQLVEFLLGDKMR